MSNFARILEKLNEGAFKKDIEEVTCPSCKEGVLQWDDEIKGLLCDNCEEQFFNKALIKKVTG